jgi:hypothetical protein
MGNVISLPVLPALHVVFVVVAPVAGTRVEAPVDPVGDRVILPVRQYPENLFSKRSGFCLLRSKLQNGYPKMTMIEIQ